MCSQGRGSCAPCDPLLDGGAWVHAVDAPMAARTPGGLAGAAIQKSALAASIAMASVAAPVFQRLGEIPAEFATADFPAPPWRIRPMVLAAVVVPGDDTGNAPTRTARLNELLGRA